MKEQILNLSKESGCSSSKCKEALEYANNNGGGHEMSIAYLKAKTLAVKTHCSFDERVLRFLEEESCKS